MLRQCSEISTPAQEAPSPPSPPVPPYSVTNWGSTSAATPAPHNHEWPTTYGGRILPQTAARTNSRRSVTHEKALRIRSSSSILLGLWRHARFRARSGRQRRRQCRRKFRLFVRFLAFSQSHSLDQEIQACRR